MQGWAVVPGHCRDLVPELSQRFLCPVEPGPIQKSAGRAGPGQKKRGTVPSRLLPIPAFMPSKLFSIFEPSIRHLDINGRDNEITITVDNNNWIILVNGKNISNLFRTPMKHNRSHTLIKAVQGKCLNELLSFIHLENSSFLIKIFLINYD